MTVSTLELSRRFGTLTAVDQVTVELPPGGVVGLVGPNGSGKSTLIRMLLGLVAPSGGSATVLGSSIAHPTEYAARVGALIESPAFVPALSARANVASLAALRGIGRDRVEEVLEVVGLDGRDDEPVRNFSLGMKQRLGIAIALLPAPELLILDEPTNGLDPAGIVEIRALLRHLGASGRTVVVSSHLLSEIETICSHVVVVRFGVLVFSGPIKELMRRAECHVDVEPERSSDLGALDDALTRAGWSVARSDDGLRIAAGADQAALINRQAADAGVTLRALGVHRESLEAVFLAMTGSAEGDRTKGAAR